jgi:hypothetical protein
MVNELSRLAPTFAGPASQTRCFLHIVNLIAKSLLRQFDATTKSSNGIATDELEEEESTENELEGRDVEDLAEGEDEASDNDEGWVDESQDLTARDLEELQRTTHPVRAALLKVRTTSDETLTTYLKPHS